MLPHPIKLSDNPGPHLRLFLEKWQYSKISVLVDENTNTYCYPMIRDFLPPHQLIEVRSGEENKTLETCEIIWTSMTDQALDRNSILLIIGGGVLGDMGGFCAATFKRGIDFILLPTTLLAMADSSIGGKLGIDFQGYKNHIGIFKEPKLNLIYPGFLKTLPLAELRSGFAEVIKHALISDRVLWDQLKNSSLESQSWEELLRHSAEFKSSVTQQDPAEKGLRKILNAGHTIGHALESHFLKMDQKIMHGEAVAAGLICEAFLSRELNMISQAECDEVTAFILKIFGKLKLNELELNRIAGLCIQDKKNRGNSIRMALLNGIGQARWDCEIKEDRIVAALAFYNALQI